MLDDIKLLGAGLEDGEHLRTHCPVCDAKEKSLSLSRQGDAVLYYCFRATCGAAGAIGSNRLVRAKQDNLPKPAPKFTPFEGELFELPDDWIDYLRENIGFEDYHIKRSRALCTGDGRIAYPVLDPIGVRRGYVLRAYDGSAPKALTFMDKEAPKTSYYMRKGDDTVLMVEDIPSAVRASKFVSCVALLGTGMTDESLIELAAYRRNIVWALDADATGTAIKQHTKHRIHFDTSRVLTLPKDFKDMTDKEINECLKETY